MVVVAGWPEEGSKSWQHTFFFQPKENKKGVVSLGILQGTRKLIKLIIHGY
jgi:hypothetical protein